MGVPQNRWFIMENPIEMEDLGVSPFQETSVYRISSTIFILTCHLTLLQHQIGRANYKINYGPNPAHPISQLWRVSSNICRIHNSNKIRQPRSHALSSCSLSKKRNKSYLTYGGFHKWGYPKWMVYIGENPSIKFYKWIMTRGTLILGNLPILREPFINSIITPMKKSFKRLQLSRLLLRSHLQRLLPRASMVTCWVHHPGTKIFRDGNIKISFKCWGTSGKLGICSAPQKTSKTWTKQD